MKRRRRSRGSLRLRLDDGEFGQVCLWWLSLPASLQPPLGVWSWCKHRVVGSSLRVWLDTVSLTPVVRVTSVAMYDKPWSGYRVKQTRAKSGWWIGSLFASPEPVWRLVEEDDRTCRPPLRRSYSRGHSIFVVPAIWGLAAGENSVRPSARARSTNRDATSRSPSNTRTPTCRRASACARLRRRR